MISVIIPTRNRANLLSVTLPTILNQSLGNERYEIIVVDNGSDDNTWEVVEFYQRNNKNITYVWEERLGLHNGRHAGMDKAKYDNLVFVDDDIWARPNWLKGITNGFEDGDVKLIGGNNLPLFAKQPPMWLQFLWSWNMKLGYKSIPALSVIEFSYNRIKEISPYNVWGCNFAVRRDIVDRAGGFHPDGMPKSLIQFRGDGESHISDFIYWNRQKCIFVPEATIYHTVTESRMTHNYFYDQGYKEGITSSYRMLRGDIEDDKPTLTKNMRNYFLNGFKSVAFKFGGRELTEVLNHYNNGVEKGFNDHIAAYNHNAQLRDWVHKGKYY